MFLYILCVRSLYAQSHHKRSLQRSRPISYLAGAENLKGFEHLATENESMEVWNSGIFQDLLVIHYKELQRGFHSFIPPWTRSPPPSARIPSDFLLRLSIDLFSAFLTTTRIEHTYLPIEHKITSKLCSYGRVFGTALICRFSRILYVAISITNFRYWYTFHMQFSV